MKLFIIDIIDDISIGIVTHLMHQFSISVPKEFYQLPLNGKIRIIENPNSPIFYTVSFPLST